MAAHNDMVPVSFFMNPITPAKNKGGRPAGSKTRPDAPSKLKKAAALSQAATFADLSAAPPIIKPDAARPDSDLFGSTPDFEKGAPVGDTSAFEPEITHLPETEDLPGGIKTEEPPAAAVQVENPELQRPLATMLWDSIIGVAAVVIGVFWYPRPVGKNVEKGEIPFDEREMVISAFCKYFHAIGMSMLSPVQELWAAIGVYCVPRLGLTIKWAKDKFFKKAKPADIPQPPGGDSRTAKTETSAQPPLRGGTSGVEPGQ